MKLMKIVMASLLLGAFSASTFAQSEEASTAGSSRFENGFLGLTVNLCTNFSTSGSTFAEDSKRQITDFMKTIPQEKGGSATPTVPEIIAFLNRYKHHIVCGEKNTNYMHYAFMKGAKNKFFTNFLNGVLYHDDHMVDVNTISYSEKTGEPLTVIDYMSEMLEASDMRRSHRKEIEEMRDMFIEEMGALSYSELSESEKQEFLQAWEAMN